MTAFDKVSTVPLTGYAPSTALGIDTTTAQLYASGLAQMWEPVGSGITLPVPVASGGTGATTAGGARANLAAAGSGSNADITSLSDIPNTAISTSGYKFGPGAFSDGVNSQATIANMAWTGTGETGYGVGVSNSTSYSLLFPGAISTSGLVIGNQVTSLGNMTVSGNVQVDSIVSRTPATPLALAGSGITGNSGVIINSGGTGTAGIDLLAFGNSYPTPNSAGAASGLFLQIVANGTLYKLNLLTN